ncbi:toll/interleukin-1 receptor domain-containing protein [Streptomyces sp. ODS28]|uniref:toll/interleukin-1 receptor domain-containing protein n=1 Tax=Streptomyces sp. ODS28 TaxID=3136688 RepID=UPI0031E81E41
MMDGESILGAVGTVATVVGTYFSYVTVRGQLRRRHRSSADDDEPPALPESGSYDAFISHTEADSEPAERLASRLREGGLNVFLAKWIGPGLIEYLEKERALLASANGVLLFSRSSMADAAIREEYAALLQRVHSGGRRFVPVLVDDVALPPFARIRRPLDLRDASASEYEEHVAALIGALQPLRDDAS